MNTTTTTPAPAPANAPALGIPQASREVAREIASECAWAIGVQCNIIADALSIVADFQARYAFGQLRKIGAAMAKAMAALEPQPGPDGAVVPDPKARLQ
jgi:hypothetical protein